MSELLSSRPRVRGDVPTFCDWCNESIVAGDPYWVDGHAMDGRVYSLHLHVECKVAVEESAEGGGGVDMRDGNRGIAINEYGDCFGSRVDRVDWGLLQWTERRAEGAERSARRRAAAVAMPYMAAAEDAALTAKESNQ